MAHMVPDVTPSGSNAETRVYEALRDQTSDDYVAIHSIPWLTKEPSKGGKPEGEIDFLVMHPKHGLLVIEVKGGQVDYDPTKDRWTSKGHDGTQTIKNPYEQAQSGVRRVLEQLRSASGLGRHLPRVGHAVMFPDGYLPPVLPMEAGCVWCGAECIDDMQGVLDKAYAYWSKAFPRSPSLSESQMDALQQIHSVSAAIGDVKGAPARREAHGPKPRLVECAGNNEMFAKLDVMLRRLIHKEGFLPSDIVILSPFRRKNSCLHGKRKISGLDVCLDMEAPCEGMIRFATIRAFKGLEAKVVLLINAGLDDKARTPADLYTGTSRARTLLYLFVRRGQPLAEMLHSRCVAL